MKMMIKGRERMRRGKGYLSYEKRMQRMMKGRGHGGARKEELKKMRRGYGVNEEGMKAR